MKSLAGYSDQISVEPGETIRFFVSSEDEMPYHARVIRIINGDLNPEGRGYREEAIASSVEGEYPGCRQPIRPGSCALVPPHPALQPLGSVAVHAWIWPTTPGKGNQVLVACAAGQRGFMLEIDAQGAVGFSVGNGERTHRISTGRALHPRRWYAVTGSYDGRTGCLAVCQSRLETGPLEDDQGEANSRIPAGALLMPPDQLLTLAAAATGGPDDPFALFYNGKLESPRIFSAAISPVAAAVPPAEAAARDDLVACWDFSRDIATDRISDVSVHGMHGRTFHMPTRAMTGHNWTGEEMAWTHRPDQYGAIHFHDDDLYDAGWAESFAWTVPSNLRSGVYCAHLSNASSEEFIPFVVRPPTGLCGRLVLLLPTASYMAYANENAGIDYDGVELLEGKLTAFHEHNLFLAEHPEYGNSLYDSHSDGSGVAYSSRLRPIMNMRPKVHSHMGGPGSAVWQFNADTHILDFLEQGGFTFDVITDEDLDRRAGLLDGCACLLTGTHPEYYSTAMLDAIDAFKLRGGRIVYLGGNGFYWRIAFHPDQPGLIELRRNEGGMRTWVTRPGEYYHAFTGEYGGMWHRNARPPYATIGTGCCAAGFDSSTYFRRTPQSRDPRVSFVFEGIAEDIIGDFGLVGGGAAGLEIDRADILNGTPSAAVVLASSERHSDGYLMVPEDIYTTTWLIGGEQAPTVHADLVFTPVAGGGATFAMSSIAWAGSLSHNGFRNNVAQLTSNVIRRFLDPAPFD